MYTKLVVKTFLSFMVDGASSSGKLDPVALNNKYSFNVIHTRDLLMKIKRLPEAYQDISNEIFIDRSEN